MTVTAKQRVVIIPGDQPGEGIDGYEGKDFESRSNTLYRKQFCGHKGLYIYFEIQHTTIQQQNCKVHNTVYAYVDTKGRASRH